MVSRPGAEADGVTLIWPGIVTVEVVPAQAVGSEVNSASAEFRPLPAPLTWGCGSLAPSRMRPQPAVTVKFSMLAATGEMGLAGEMVVTVRTVESVGLWAIEVPAPRTRKAMMARAA